METRLALVPDNWEDLGSVALRAEPEAHAT
jgi:hypothetical protein